MVHPHHIDIVLPPHLNKCPAVLHREGHILHPISMCDKMLSHHYDDMGVRLIVDHTPTTNNQCACHTFIARIQWRLEDKYNLWQCARACNYNSVAQAVAL